MCYQEAGLTKKWVVRCFTSQVLRTGPSLEIGVKENQSRGQTQHQESGTRSGEGVVSQVGTVELNSREPYTSHAASAL